MPKWCGRRRRWLDTSTRGARWADGNCDDTCGKGHSAPLVSFLGKAKTLLKSTVYSSSIYSVTLDDRPILAPTPVTSPAHFAGPSAFAGGVGVPIDSLVPFFGFPSATDASPLPDALGL